jgi:signal transduction histidine kinase
VNPSLTPRQIPNRIVVKAGRIIDQRRGAIGLVVAAGLLSVVSMLYAMTVFPSQDFVLDPEHRQVRWVLAGGRTWNNGVRPGQSVVRLAQGDGEWELITTGISSDVHGSQSSGHVESLRATLPQALAAIGLSVGALVLLPGRWRLSAAVALISLGVASIPLAASNQLVVSSATLAVVPTFGAAWVASEKRVAHRRWALPTTGFVVVLWLIARLWLPEAYSIAEAARVGVLGSLMVIALFYAVPWNAWLGESVRLDPSLATDVGALVLVLAMAIVAVALGASTWFVAPIALGLLAIYPRVRRRVGSALEQLIFGGIRDHAAVAATEEERARLASEIHDGPLQELAAVIGDLDEQPQAEGAAALLRDVAAQLRNVTTALRPPVLDDLGLGAAVAWLVEQTTHRGVVGAKIECNIADVTRVGRTERPPTDVELAAFRIVQEALGNAVRHANASQIVIGGTISPGTVELSVTDDGCGIDDTVVRDARRAGRLGIPSMYQRADSIDADLTIAGGPTGGTSITLRWAHT